jgi:alpha-beta hydrolase superfamily lysophospholipase
MPPELVAWSIVAVMRFDEFDLPMADGVAVHVRRWRPDGEPRAVVQIAHGMAEHSGRYARLAGVLVDAGHAVWAHDHRGHGRTARTDDDLGHFADEDGFALVVDDLLAVRSDLGREGQDGAGRPVALFAHSMGTFVSQAALALRPPSPWDAVILAGSDAPGGLSYRAFLQTAKVERRLHGPRRRSTTLHELAFGPYNIAFRPTRTDSDWLSRDADEVDRFLADPRTGFHFTNQAWVDFIGGREHVAHTGFDALDPKDLPILLIAGDKDPVGRKGKGVRMLADQLRGAGLGDVEVRLYPGARHELVNETNRDEVHADVLEFLERTLG